MNIALVCNARLPVTRYGGTERVVWSLGKALSALGHQVTFVTQPGSCAPFAKVVPWDFKRSPPTKRPAILNEVDIVHYQNAVPPELQSKIPYIVTVHGNRYDHTPLDRNSVFISRQHAHRHGSQTFVYNGIDWDVYGKVDIRQKRQDFHFLAKANWRVKNLRGAIATVKRCPGNRLQVMGGRRIDLHMGFRCTLSPRIRFHGRVDDARKQSVCQRSRGLVFPVTWHEPFGLAITESLFFGTPVFATTYGSLPELVPKEVGFLANSASELADAMTHADDYSATTCHQWARDRFDAITMAHNYVTIYERVLNQGFLHQEAPQVSPEYWQRILPWK